MRNFFQKSYRWASLFTLLLIGSFVFVMLDTFAIPKSYKTVEPIVTQANEDSEAGIEGNDTVVSGEKTTDISQSKTSKVNTSSSSGSKKPIITDYSYEDSNIKINIETIRKYDSDIYVADIQLSDAMYLKTALAKDLYGRNIKETTSEIAESHDAIFAINGDFYGFRDYGHVLRNGVLYRNSAGDEDSLVIDQRGDFQLLDEGDNLLSLDLNFIWQILSFGPALVKDGKIAVTDKSEVSRAMTSNPRTAIGQISKLHYLIIVSDGRTDKSEGLSLKELAEVFVERGCVIAYNLDGGGSSTMYFNGEIINIPTDGRSIGEREVSDIVYIGY